MTYDLFLRAERPSDPRDLLLEVIKRCNDPAKQKQTFKAMSLDDNKLLAKTIDVCFEDWSRRATNGNAARPRWRRPPLIRE